MYQKIHAIFILIFAASVWSCGLLAAEAGQADNVIGPDIKRKSTHLPAIDSENFEISLGYGGIGFEDFSSSSTVSASLALHVTEDVFLEATAAQAEVSDTSFRRIGVAVFPNEKETIEYYHLNVGLNVLPGEIFVRKKWVFNSSFYFTGGGGFVNFVDNNEFAFNVGGGLRVLVKDWLSIRLEAKDFIFDNDILGKKKRTHNYEFKGIVGYFF